MSGSADSKVITLQRLYKVTLYVDAELYYTVSASNEHEAYMKASENLENSPISVNHEHVYHAEIIKKGNTR